VISQREFRIEFGVHCKRAVPSAHAIKIWVRNFEATDSALKKKCKNSTYTREYCGSERGHWKKPTPFCAVSLGLSEASVRRILHKDLHFYPNKIQVTHALHERDYVNRVNFCQTFLQLINQNQELVNKLLMRGKWGFCFECVELLDVLNWNWKKF
jgi:hypothetical protein